MNGQREEWGEGDAAPQLVKKKEGGGPNPCDECISS